MTSSSSISSSGIGILFIPLHTQSSQTDDDEVGGYFVREWNRSVLKTLVKFPDFHYYTPIQWEPASFNSREDLKPFFQPSHFNSLLSQWRFLFIFNSQAILLYAAIQHQEQEARMTFFARKYPPSLHCLSSKNLAGIFFFISVRSSNARRCSLCSDIDWKILFERKCLTTY